MTWARASSLAPALLAVAACQQILGLDEPTDRVEAVGRTCECGALTLQGAEFEAACTDAVDSGDKELLLAAAARECTDCANVTDCYQLLTSARDESKSCEASSECSSWACCVNDLHVELVLDQGLKPQLAFEDRLCCATCKPCKAALDEVGDGVLSIVVCAEAQPLLEDLLGCIAPFIGQCPDACNATDGPTGACLACALMEAGTACDAPLAACNADDLARPIAEPE